VAVTVALSDEWIDCRLHTEYDGGDHLVVIGDVHRPEAPAEPRQPLLYYRGCYTRIAATS
jgi:3-hydroxy-9,10-secoandrosta-1,3,5(10)-triene-9,17-dione monooxygenase reductase component